MIRWIAVVAAVVVIPASGILTVGLVTTGSMEPTLPPDSVFVAIPGDPEVGDIVVYERPDGVRVVHRVVDRTPEGLVTQGDANEVPDQERGVPPIAPDRTAVVPTVAGHPVAIPGTDLVPVGLVVAQVALLTAGLSGLADGEESLPVIGSLRSWHLFVAAGVLLIASAPMHVQTVEADGDQMELSSWLVPTTARVADEDGARFVTMGPLDTATVEASGTATVVRAPAVPGAQLLSGFGATWAMLPAAATVWTLGGVVRYLEVGRWT